MKKETVLKILRRYEKGLATMEIESRHNEDIADSEHYRIDKRAIHEAIICVERSNTES